MKISFIAEKDWANVLTEYCYCLNKHSEGIEAKSICVNKHSLNYKIQHDYDLSVCSSEQKQEALQFLQDSDIIVFGEERRLRGSSNYNILQTFMSILGIDLFNSDKKLLIWHPGSLYRHHYKFFNRHPSYNRLHKHLYAIDLYRRSRKTSNDIPLFPYQYSDFSYDKFISDFKSKLKIKPWTILHIPRDARIKGTGLINSAISNLNLDHTEFNYKVLTRITHSEVMREKQKSLFYIDQVNINGGYGIASLEAIFLSNLTFSSSHHILDSIEKLTGKTELPLISLDADLQKTQATLKEFLQDSDEDKLISIMEKIGKWIEQYNSPEGIIKHFNNLIK